MSEAPGHIVASRRIFDGRVVHLRVDTVARSDGRSYDIEVVEHGGAVAMVPLDDEGNVYLIRQYRDSVREYLLEVPAGGLEPDEPPTECARRELQEEIGFYPEQLEELGSFYLAPGYSTERITLYVARGLRPARLPGDVDEDISVERLPLRRALELALTGRIKDAKTILGLIWVARRLGITLPAAEE